MTYITILLIILIVFLLYFLMVCPNLSRKEKLKPYLRREWAHRGLHDISQLIPENSMFAFTEAMKSGYAIELDVHLTSDRKVVVFHDDNLKRLCGVDETINHLTYAQLQKLHLCGTFERIPLLSEVLDYVYGQVPLLIEIKMPKKDTLICKYVKAELDSYKGDYLIQSFNSLALHWFRKNSPDTLRGQLSCNLTKSDHDNPYFVRFLVKHLLTNGYGRPDFISYKFEDTHNFGLWLNQRILGVPIAVWTLRTSADLKKAKANYDMFIFENIK